MPTFIKAGFWEKLCKPCIGYKGWLNLDDLIKSLASTVVGPPGPMGPQGPQGVEGPQGIQGEQGDQGPQGTAGNSVTILGSVADMAAFLAGPGASPGANIGDAWILLSDGSLMSWNGTIWFDAGDIKGPQGDQGPQGIQGIQGPQGLQGIQGVQGPAGLNGVGYHGSFFDTTTQSVTSGDVKAMEFNNTDVTSTNGFAITNNTLGRPTRITATYAGVYNLQFSAQLNRTSGGSTKQVDIWIAVNETPVPSSNTGITLVANSNKSVAAWNFFVPLNAGQYVELMWTQDDAIDILYEAATGVIPVDTPSVIATINQVG